MNRQALSWPKAFLTRKPSAIWFRNLCDHTYSIRQRPTFLTSGSVHNKFNTTTVPSLADTDFHITRYQQSRCISSFSDSNRMTDQFYTNETPEPVRSAKGLHLITQSTPNGQKLQILLEELKEVYGTEWTTSLINIGTNEQKKDWFLRLNPNGRIPVVIDNSQSPPYPVMETSAELLYLVQREDKDHVFSFTDYLTQNECLQWLFFWHGSGAPYQGQTNHFNRFAKEKVPYAIERFKNETLRVFGVLEIRLSGKYTGKPRDYLVGDGTGKYSVADIGTWPWVKSWEFNQAITADDMEAFPNLLKWIERIASRPAVQRGTGDDYNAEKRPDLYVGEK